MSSTFTWLDYRSEDREQILQLINDLRQPEARDELGIGRVRDRLADLLFPGTSTIQTRVRYFLFIPWIYQKIEDKKLDGQKASQTAREFEGYLINTLKEKEELDGLIGRYAGANVKRMASSVYWNGLYTWGIRRYNESQSEYYNRLKVHYLRVQENKKRNSTHHKYDDNQRVPDIGNWDIKLPEAPSSFPYSNSDISMQLTREEAKYLYDTLCTNTNTKDSLFAFFLMNGIEIDETIKFAWDVDGKTLDLMKRQPNLYSILIHARNFSLVIQGGRLLYNFLLAKQAKDRGIFGFEMVERYNSDLNNWVEDMQKNIEELQSWLSALEQDFWQTVGTENIPARTKQFIDTWLEWSITDPVQAIESSKSSDLIIEREWQLKRRKARLSNADALQIWGGESGAGQLDYRWNNPARRFINEILTALGDSNVTA